MTMQVTSTANLAGNLAGFGDVAKARVAMGLYLGTAIAAAEKCDSATAWNAINKAGTQLDIIKANAGAAIVSEERDKYLKVYDEVKRKVDFCGGKTGTVDPVEIITSEAPGAYATKSGKTFYAAISKWYGLVMKYGKPEAFQNLDSVLKEVRTKVHKFLGASGKMPGYTEKLYSLTGQAANAAPILSEANSMAASPKWKDLEGKFAAVAGAIWADLAQADKQLGKGPGKTPVEYARHDKKKKDKKEGDGKDEPTPPVVVQKPWYKQPKYIALMAAGGLAAVVGTVLGVKKLAAGGEGGVSGLSAVGTVTRRDAEKEWRKYVLPLLKQRYEQDGVPDYPVRSESWGVFIDALAKEGRITMKQYASWSAPSECSRRR